MVLQWLFQSSAISGMRVMGDNFEGLVASC
jgi:hypothetical protein